MLPAKSILTLVQRGSGLSRFAQEVSRNVSYRGVIKKGSTKLLDKIDLVRLSLLAGTMSCSKAQYLLLAENSRQTWFGKVFQKFHS